jgi:hypothetical protein
MKHTATQALVTIAIALAIVVAVKVIQARAAEILLAELSDDAGNVTVHQVNLKDTFCVKLLNKFKEDAKNGKPITLTIEAPPKSTGIVVEAHCVMPDGSIKHFKAPTI